jgi:hypothetical protein
MYVCGGVQRSVLLKKLGAGGGWHLIRGHFNQQPPVTDSRLTCTVCHPRRLSFAKVVIEAVILGFDLLAHLCCIVLCVRVPVCYNLLGCG